MIVYRLAREEYSKDLSGIGAELTGGRWNYKGTRMIYTADSRALCTAEIAVHTPVGIIPKDYKLVTIEIPDDVDYKKINAMSLPDNWKKFPHSHITQEIGDKFISENKDLCLKVPSAVVQGDFNILINPNHRDFKKIKIINIERFDFDERLFR